ncbi:hypothetical protein VOLCADRAFT_90598 [Volvox carteri f. nagariensis]|uniref:Uncharacterized protein n=1 Tax=Volvox carteri f. nagariensis TaxID=3068 RepID=D8TUU4_VOLCA|nr:uncharacterized protein VOLCADRAFT_90598 [Volvox carteri f. nagariensis]EFJ48882.1 hypothetical protein VOLCADRAFT_90598 [Volvox carteri f. nagariensis]|eukprot:XP_002950214.1 hypothetical protein VOLCADRAFT_90598 [Volvox carteri f. nagariensis]
MFHMSSPWDGRAWIRPADDEAYPFAAPLHELRASVPFEDFEIDADHPAAFPHRAYYARGRPRAAHTAFVPCAYPQQPRRTCNSSSAIPPAARGMCDRLDEMPYGFRYPRRAPAAPEPVFYPARAHIPPFRVMPHRAAAVNDMNAYGHTDDDHDFPVLLDTGLCFRAAVPSAANAAGGKKASFAAKDDRATEPQRATEAKSRTSYNDASTLNDNTVTTATTTRTRTAAAARPANTGTGPTRIEVRAAADGSNGAGGGQVPVITTSAVPANSAKAAKTAAAAATAAATVAPQGAPLERQHSTALVTRPPLEISLSRGPSAVLPSAASSSSSAAAVTTASADAAAAAAAAATPHSKGPLATAAAVTVSSAAAAASRMTRSQAVLWC